MPLFSGYYRVPSDSNQENSRDILPADDPHRCRSSILERAKPLFLLSWGLFATSLLLPSASGLAGWDCARLCFMLPFENGLDGGAVFLSLGTMANITMTISAPLVLITSGKSALNWLKFLTSASILYIILLRLVFGTIQNSITVPSFQLGFYVWGASFILLLAALIRQRNQSLPRDAQGCAKLGQI